MRPCALGFQDTLDRGDADSAKGLSQAIHAALAQQRVPLLEPDVRVEERRELRLAHWREQPGAAGPLWAELAAGVGYAAPTVLELRCLAQSRDHLLRTGTPDEV